MTFKVGDLVKSRKNPAFTYRVVALLKSGKRGKRVKVEVVMDGPESVTFMGCTYSGYVDVYTKVED